MLSTLPYYAKAPLIYGAMSLKSMVLTNHTIEVLMNPPFLLVAKWLQHVHCIIFGNKLSDSH